VKHTLELQNIVAYHSSLGPRRIQFVRIPSIICNQLTLVS